MRSYLSLRSWDYKHIPPLCPAKLCSPGCHRTCDPTSASRAEITDTYHHAPLTCSLLWGFSRRLSPHNSALPEEGTVYNASTLSPEKSDAVIPGVSGCWRGIPGLHTCIWGIYSPSEIQSFPRQELGWFYLISLLFIWIISHCVSVCGLCVRVQVPEAVGGIRSP